MTQVGTMIELSVSELEVLLKAAQERVKPTQTPLAAKMGAGLAALVSTAEAIPRQIAARLTAFRSALATQRMLAKATYQASRQGLESAQVPSDALILLQQAIEQAKAGGGTVTLPADLLAKATRRV